jgi:hypothetical protein
MRKLHRVFVFYGEWLLLKCQPLVLVVSDYTVKLTALGAYGERSFLEIFIDEDAK